VLNPFDAVITNLSRELTRILQFFNEFHVKLQTIFLTKYAQSIIEVAKISLKTRLQRQSNKKA